MACPAARAVLHGLHGALEQLAQISRDLKVSREVVALVPGLLKQIHAGTQQAQAEQHRLAELVEKQTELNPQA